jgi:hypothetical protein
MENVSDDQRAASGAIGGVWNYRDKIRRAFKDDRRDDAEFYFWQGVWEGRDAQAGLDREKFPDLEGRKPFLTLLHYVWWELARTGSATEENRAIVEHEIAQGFPNDTITPRDWVSEVRTSSK